MQETTRTRIEAEVFQRLLRHLDERKDVQNIDLMNLAGFCRNCLAKWYVAAAESNGAEIDLDQAREIIYGMPYAEWKRLHQKEATPEQRRSFSESQSAGNADA
ncbi:DUF1244 domain-containing protein [Thioalkalivibrio sp.]|uniref:DUF1244 domain-containing protein n=1 Tax=Thioalkalivibrio sp. TaxID=2093813 RepID=UPI0035613708